MEENRRIRTVEIKEYLRLHHRNDIVDIMNETEDSSNVSIYVDLNTLCQVKPKLFTDVTTNVHEETLTWSNILFELQKEYAQRDDFLDPNYLIKSDSRVRFHNLSEQDPRNRSTFPTNDNIGEFIQIKGTVLRCSQPKFLEYKKVYVCGHCKCSTVVEGEYEKHYVVHPPSCPNGCKGQPYSDPENLISGNCIEYQEIKIMEPFTKKSIPSMIVVTLENDLVDSCQPGDSVTICGTVASRWMFGKSIKITITVRANSISNKTKTTSNSNDLPEHLICIRAEWQEFKAKFGELGARDILIQSMSPDIYGTHLAKLAIALAICSGDQPSSTVSGLRSHSHVLLIGDPGVAKSKLLKFASSIAPRSVHTTGAGCSAAGLTAAAIQEDGEWHLEAGALMLADNGVCCIDEFNLMSESDKASLLEAMEQQTVSIAKAGISCKLNTRCSVIAATNPKNLYSMSEKEGTTAINIGIASALLSRFDLVLVLRDERNEEWDTIVSKHILFGIGPSQNEHLYDINQLQTHFAAIRDIKPIITDGASRILRAYYMACRADLERYVGRTTLRLNDSLYRLATAHAKLVFRNEVTEVDAVIVIMLMESSFGSYGQINKPMNIVRQNIPLGPSNEQIQEVMDKLQLGIWNDRDQVSADVDTTKISQFETKEQKRIADGVPENDLSKYKFVPSKMKRICTTTNKENVLRTDSVPSPHKQNKSEYRSTDLLIGNQLNDTLVSQSITNSQPVLSNVSYRNRILSEIDMDELDRILSWDDSILQISQPNSGQAGASNNTNTLRIQADVHEKHSSSSRTDLAYESLNVSTQQKQNSGHSQESNQNQNDNSILLISQPNSGQSHIEARDITNVLEVRADVQRKHLLYSFEVDSAYESVNVSTQQKLNSGHSQESNKNQNKDENHQWTQRKRIFPECTEEDLSCLDSLDF